MGNDSSHCHPSHLAKIAFVQALRLSYIPYRLSYIFPPNTHTEQHAQSIAKYTLIYNILSPIFTQQASRANEAGSEHARYPLRTRSPPTPLARGKHPADACLRFPAGTGAFPVPFTMQPPPGN